MWVYQKLMEPITIKRKQLKLPSHHTTRIAHMPTQLEYTQKMLCVICLYTLTTFRLQTMRIYNGLREFPAREQLLSL